MNSHLAIICALPTALFLGGGFLTYIGYKYRHATDDDTIYNLGTILIGGAIAMVLQSLYSIYLG